MNITETKENKVFNLFFYASLCVLAIIYIIGMQMDLMDVDATQYALISKEMFHSHSYLQVYCNGQDYLDKPPLLFWTACLSFSVFGVHDWAFRLPSILCIALGVYSVYRYSKLYYAERVAKIAALITASCCATYLMAHDVRCDTMLTGFVIFTIWQLAEFNLHLKFKNLLLGAIGIGLSMLTKGPLGLIIPVVAFSTEFIYKRQWKNFFRWQYLVVIVVVALMLLPMSIGLYEQFDMHPEKTVYSLKGPSGLRFYYWTQSFGRITGENYWNNNPDPFFLIHSFFWSFLPWTVFFLVALFTEIKEKVKTWKTHSSPEAITLGGFLLIFIFLTRSKYQLPHYTFPLHPLAAVIAAKYLYTNFTSPARNKLFSVTNGVHIFVMFVIFTLAFVLLNLVFPVSIIYSVLVAIPFAFFLLLLFNNKLERTLKILLTAIVPMATLGFVLNLNFYPTLLTYQLGPNLGRELTKIAPPGSHAYFLNDWSNFSTHFYTDVPVKDNADTAYIKANLVKGKTFIIADSTQAKNILALNPGITVVEKLPNFGVTGLEIQFLNPATREKDYPKVVLMKY